MAVLRYLDETGGLKTAPLDSEQFLIGRADSCQVVFHDDMISREHARIDLERDGRFRIRDLGSRNKTYVNGELSNESLLFPGDIIRVGDHVLEYLDDAAGAEPFDLEFLTPDRSEPPNSEWIKIKSPLSLTCQQIGQLALLLAEQPSTARIEDMAAAAMGQALLDVQAERGFVALKGQGKLELLPLTQRALKRAAGASLTPVSQSFALAPMLQQVAGRYPQTAGQIDTKLGYAATAMIAPLTHHGDVLGILYVDRPLSKKPFSPAALQYIAAAGALLGATIAESSRRLARAAVREGAAWMSVIRRLQNTLTLAATASDTFAVARMCQPGRARCGDFGDVFHLDEQRCCMLVVDGGGRGVSGITQAAAIRMAVRTAIAVSEDIAGDPGPMFNYMNTMISGLPSRQIVPCTFVVVDLASGKLTYIAAGGMPPLLMVGPGRLITLDQPSLVLGVDREYVYEPTRADLPEAFRMVCYTDGLVESGSAGGEPWGDQRLHEILLERESFTTAEEIVARVNAGWTTHMAGVKPDDDALVLVVARG